MKELKELILAEFIDENNTDCISFSKKAFDEWLPEHDKEVAREIFEEIKAHWHLGGFDSGRLRDLEEKYQEVE